MVLVVTSVAAYATVGGYYGGQLWHAQEAMATFCDSISDRGVEECFMLMLVVL